MESSRVALLIKEEENLRRRLMNRADDCFALVGELSHGLDDDEGHRGIQARRWFVAEQKRRIAEDLYTAAVRDNPLFASRCCTYFSGER